jgi:hypothetical protein
MKHCLLLTVLLAAACGGSVPAARPAAQRGEPAFERVLDRIGDDGTIDRDTALQAFALAFAPAPGVSTPPGPAEPIASGSGPLRWVVAHLDELTPAQRRAVRAVVPRPARTAAATAAVTLMAAGEQAQFQALVSQAWAYWSRTFPKSVLLHPIDRWSITLNDKNLWAAGAYTYPVDAQSQEVGPVTDCEIYFNPKVRAGTDAEKREATYHEVFHCFEAQMVPALTGYYAVASSGNGPGPGAWLIEGGAAYGMDLALAGRSAPTPFGAGFWTKYFQTPTTPLFKRTYSAIGFFAHLAETGIDVMARMPAAILAVVGRGGNVAAFDALLAGASADRFFATWPTSLLRKPALGAEWDARGPGITADATVPGDVVAGNGSPTAGGQVPAYANDDRRVAVSSDVLLLGAHTYARMRATGGAFDSSSPSGLYCTMGAACACPQGSPAAGVKFQPLDRGSYYLALGGGRTGSTWSLASYGLDQFCKQPLADACLYGTWRLQGLPPPLPLPAQVTIVRADETLTIDRSGLLALDVDIVDSVHVSGGPTGNGEVKGPIRIRALAQGGVIQPLSADLSGLVAHATVGPVAITLPVTQLIPDIQNDLTPVAYRCAGSTLFLTSQIGTTFTFTRA